MTDSWENYETWVMMRGTTRNGVFHASPECDKIKRSGQAVERSERYVAYHEPEPCELCHAGVGRQFDSYHDGRDGDQTSIGEMREMARGNDQFKQRVERLIRTEAFDEYPFRDYDELQRVVETADSPSDVVAHFDCTYQAIQRWCRAYGIEYPEPGHCTVGESPANASPEQLGDD